MKEIQGKSILVALGFELSEWPVVYSIYGIVYCCLVHLLEPRIVNMPFLPPSLLVPRLFAGGKIVS